MAIESIFSELWFRHIIIIIVTLLGASIIIKWATYLLKRARDRWDMDVTLIQVIHEIVKYSIYVAALVIILNEFGFDLTAVALSLGIVGVAVSFGARDTVSNFISGMFILADKSFRVGDIIEVSNKKGKVVKVGFRLTTLRTYDKKIITVPNSSFSTSPYINYTASDSRRVDLDITMPYSMGLEKTIKSLEDIASGCDWVLKKPKPKVIVKELSDVGVKLMLCTWINDPWKVTESRSLLAKKVNELLRNKEQNQN